jgi:hypothetical protein
VMPFTVKQGSLCGRIVANLHFPRTQTC